MTRIRLPRMRQRGAAAIEAALLAIPLVILLLGIAEIGRACFQYNSIAKSTRDAVRYLSMVEPGTRHAEAACLVVFGSTSCPADAQPLAEGLATGQVTVCDAVACPDTHRNVPATGNAGPATGVMNLVTVTVAGYQSNNFMSLFGEWIGFDQISATMRQQL